MCTVGIDTYTALHIEVRVAKVVEMPLLVNLSTHGRDVAAKRASPVVPKAFSIRYLEVVYVIESKVIPVQPCTGRQLPEDVIEVFYQPTKARRVSAESCVGPSLHSTRSFTQEPRVTAFGRIKPRRDVAMGEVARPDATPTHKYRIPK